MISILMKREALKDKPLTVETFEATDSVDLLNDVGAISESALSQSVRTAFADKPWEETQNVFKQDQSRLRTLSGSKEKDPYKQELINKYRPLVEKLLVTHKGDYGNLDVMWCFYMWHFDLGKFEEIHDDFRAAIDCGLETPANFKENGQTGFCGYVFKYTHKAHTDKREYKREYLLKAVNDLLAGELATNAPLKVKMFRLVGDWHLEAGEKEKAHNLFEIVMKLDPQKGGVKKKLEALQKELGYDQPH
ncbi:phage terminase small subunit [Vibrio lentus]|uniref:phage terminase small subunit n=1 Tax=Vibrio lentus TaxID=136468 RepID=UPI000C85C735|nr:phage terminase small subunit [Vibrio lentus]